MGSETNLRVSCSTDREMWFTSLLADCLRDVETLPVCSTFGSSLLDNLFCVYSVWK
jgi:hypothetical protein